MFIGSCECDLGFLALFTYSLAGASKGFQRVLLETEADANCYGFGMVGTTKVV